MDKPDPVLELLKVLNKEIQDIRIALKPKEGEQKMIKFADRHMDEIKNGTVLICLIELDCLIKGEEYTVIVENNELVIVDEDGQLNLVNQAFAENFAIKNE